MTIRAKSLWDEQALLDRLMGSVLQLDRQRLSAIEAPALPGVYLQFVASASLTPILGPLVSSGRFPAYVGVAADLCERLDRYRRNLADMTTLTERDLYVALLPLQSISSARYSESLLIDHLNPPLQGMGWGSKHPGPHRTEQSPIDALLPGRRWAKPAPPAAVASARLRVLSKLLSLDPAGPRWDPLD